MKQSIYSGFNTNVRNIAWATYDNAIITVSKW